MRASGSYMRINLISAIIAISLVIPAFASYAASIDIKPAVPASKLRTDYASGYTKEKIKAAYISMIRDEGTVVGEVMILDFGSGRACRNAYEDFTDKISLERVLAVTTSEISSKQSVTVIERDGYYYCLTLTGKRLTFAKAKSEEAAFDAFRLSRVKGGFPGGLPGKIVLLALIIWGIKSVRKPLSKALTLIFKKTGQPKKKGPDFRKLWKFAGKVLIFALLCFAVLLIFRVGSFVLHRIKHSVMATKEQPAKMAVEEPTPVEEMPVEETPVEEEIPVEQAPVEETPAAVEEPVAAKVPEGPPYIQLEDEDTLSFLSRNEAMLDLGDRYYTEIRLGDWHPDMGEFTRLSNPYSYMMRGMNDAGDAAVISFGADVNYQNGTQERVYQYFLVARNPDRTWKVIATHQSVTEELVGRYGLDPALAYGN